MVPWLGHMFFTKRTPARSSPAATPCSCSASGGCTETRRAWPSAIASRAALTTAARAQPPPIQPSEIVPSGRITAFAPAFAAVAATVRTTVASANGSPAARFAEIEIEDVASRDRHQILARYGSSAARLSRLCAGANRST